MILYSTRFHVCGSLSDCAGSWHLKTHCLGRDQRYRAGVNGCSLVSGIPRRVCDVSARQHQNDWTSRGKNTRCLPSNASGRGDYMRAYKIAICRRAGQPQMTGRLSNGSPPWRNPLTPRSLDNRSRAFRSDGFIKDNATRSAAGPHAGQPVLFFPALLGTAEGFCPQVEHL